MNYSNTNPGVNSDPFNQQSFLIESLINQIWTAIPVKVMAVYPPHSVDCQPLVAQRAGNDETIPTTTLYNLPYVRIQGGQNALIIDPKVGDIGLAVFCMRDISQFKQNKAMSNQGSLRTYDPSDGIYIGGLLNQPPVRYVEVKDDGIVVEAAATKVTVHGASSVELNSDTKITLNAPLIELNGQVVQKPGSGSGAAANFTSDIISGTISLQKHTHGGIQRGDSNTNKPNA